MSARRDRDRVVALVALVEALERGEPQTLRDLVVRVLGWTTQRAILAIAAAARAGEIAGGGAQTRELWQVAAQGRFVGRLGKRCFARPLAEAIAEDLRRRGYQDAHAQRWRPEAPLPPFALTLSCVAPGAFR